MFSPNATNMKFLYIDDVRDWKKFLRMKLLSISTIVIFVEHLTNIVLLKIETQRIQIRSNVPW